MKISPVQTLNVEFSIGEVEAILEDLGFDTSAEDVPLDGHTPQFVVFVEALKAFRGDYDRLGG